MLFKTLFKTLFKQRGALKRSSKPTPAPQMVVLVLGACGVIAAASQRPEFAETPQPITAAEMPMIPAIVVLSFLLCPPKRICALCRGQSSLKAGVLADLSSVSTVSTVPLPLSERLWSRGMRMVIGRVD